MLGWIGPGFSCSSPEFRGHSGGPIDISILRRGRLESGGGKAPGPFALNMYIPGASVVPGSVLNGYKFVMTLRINH